MLIRFLLEIILEYQKQAALQGISEKIGRILKQQKVKVAYKPQQTINSFFRAPRARWFWPPEIWYSVRNQMHTV